MVIQAKNENSLPKYNGSNESRNSCPEPVSKNTTHRHSKAVSNRTRGIYPETVNISDRSIIGAVAQVRNEVRREISYGRIAVMREKPCLLIFKYGLIYFSRFSTLRE